MSDAELKRLRRIEKAARKLLTRCLNVEIYNEIGMRAQLNKGSYSGVNLSNAALRDAIKALVSAKEMRRWQREMEYGYIDPHIENVAETTGEAYGEAERRLWEDDDMPGHRG